MFQEWRFRILFLLINQCRIGEILDVAMDVGDFCCALNYLKMLGKSLAVLSIEAVN